jgi:hypothetical protein
MFMEPNWMPVSVYITRMRVLTECHASLLEGLRSLFCWLIKYLYLFKLNIEILYTVRA